MGLWYQSSECLVLWIYIGLKIIHLSEESETQHNAKSLSRSIKFKSLCSAGLGLWMEIELQPGMTI
jgi:hypothetical protein